MPFSRKLFHLDQLKNRAESGENTTSPLKVLKGSLTMRSFVSFFALLLAASLPVAAHADSLTYDFTLTQTNGGNIGYNNGQVVGSGSFTITSPTSTPGSLNYFAANQNMPNPADPITALEFTIDGMTFNLADAGVNTVEMEFSNGVLTTIGYAGTLSNGGTFYFNSNLGTLSYNLSGPNTYDTGIIGDIQLASTPTAATPEPSALLLFGTGVFGLAALTRRRIFA